MACSLMELKKNDKLYCLIPVKREGNTEYELQESHVISMLSDDGTETPSYWMSLRFKYSEKYHTSDGREETRRKRLNIYLHENILGRTTFALGDNNFAKGNAEYGNIIVTTDKESSEFLSILEKLISVLEEGMKSLQNNIDKIKNIKNNADRREDNKECSEEGTGTPGAVIQGPTGSKQRIAEFKEDEHWLAGLP